MGKFFTNILLGNSTSPMAGDGFYGAPSTRSLPLAQAKLPLPSSSPESQEHVTHNDYFGPVNSRQLSPQAPRTPSLTPEIGQSSDQTRLGNSKKSPRQEEPLRTPRLANGVRAPRSSIATMAALTIPTMAATEIPNRSEISTGSPRQSTESFHAAASESSTQSPASQTCNVPDVGQENSWEDYEIPQELGLLEDELPQEVKNIVQESLDEHRVMRVSRLKARELGDTMDKLAAETSNSRGQERPVIAGSSRIVSSSSQSTSTSASSHNRSNSSMSITPGSETSLDLERDDGGSLKPPTRPLGASSATIAPDHLRSKRVLKYVPTEDMTDMEKRFMESKLRTRKGYKIFQRLPGRKMKDEPSPDFLRIDGSISECTGCFDEVSDTKAVALPCGSKFCQTCFPAFVRSTTRSEDSFPPKCCHIPIPQHLIRRHLTKKDLAWYEEKALEYAVPVSNRYYCVNTSCAKWIDTRKAPRKHRLLQCPHCRVKLCTLCRGPEHSAREACPQDFDLERTLEQAERAGWKRCIDCQAVVEWNTGCHHMTCLCKAEFCYICGSRWKTCRCTNDDLLRLQEEASIRVARYEADQRAEEEEMRAAVAAVRAAAEALEAERALEEERAQEEQREYERQERVRLENIAHYYGYLREVLGRVRLMQRTAIEKRHDCEWDEIDRMRDDLDSAEKAADMQREVDKEREEIISKTNNTIKALQRRHATTMMETITRHRRDQDDFFDMSAECTDEATNLANAEKLEWLMSAHNLERSTLKAQQVHEIQKYKTRCEGSLKDFDVKTKILQMRLGEAEFISQREKAMRSILHADSKWFDLIFDVRYSMLMDDQKRMERSGADAPTGPKRDTVVFPGSFPCSPRNEDFQDGGSGKGSLTPRAESIIARRVSKQKSLTPRSTIFPTDQMRPPPTAPKTRDREPSISTSQRPTPSISLQTNMESSTLNSTQSYPARTSSHSAGPSTTTPADWNLPISSPAPRTRERSVSAVTAVVPQIASPIVSPAAPKREAPQIPSHSAWRRDKNTRPPLPWERYGNDDVIQLGGRSVVKDGKGRSKGGSKGPGFIFG